MFRVLGPASDWQIRLEDTTQETSSRTLSHVPTISVNETESI